MVLHHITKGTRLIIVATTFFYTQALCKGNLNIIDVFAIPNILKDHVGKTNSKDTLNHLFT